MEMPADSENNGQLFDVGHTAIIKHLTKIYNSGELNENSTCAKMAQVANNGKTYQYKFYSLAAIIISYRFHSLFIGIL
jgi:hypothetical protein